MILKNLCQAINGHYNGDLEKDSNFEINGVSIDSRKIAEKNVFFAFKGERVNGEDYVSEVLSKGATVAVVSTGYSGNEKRIIRVKNVEWALQELARVYFEDISVPVIAISGSVGKTSTKDMIASVLSEKFHVFKTKGNFNNEIGLPLMLLEIDSTYDVAVLELGMNHYGELKRLSELTKHQIAVLTGIGTAHIEFFGTRENIFKAKMEIAHSLDEEGVLIVNGLDDLLATVKSEIYEVIPVGRETDSIYAQDIRVDASGTHFSLKSAMWEVKASMGLWGEHHVTNALLATVVALRLGMDIETIVCALADVKPTAMRFEVIPHKDRIIINDAYNASADSLFAATRTFTQMPMSCRWAVFGDIFECGEQSKAIHSHIGETLNTYSLDRVVFIGHAMIDAYNHYNGHKDYFVSIEEALDYILTALPQACGILVKASRGMALERIVHRILEA
jgi:UDP-N-acetylmuramoyl-tripeptide--D-alanyl-D-alanine ligase